MSIFPARPDLSPCLRSLAGRDEDTPPREEFEENCFGYFLFRILALDIDIVSLNIICFRF